METARTARWDSRAAEGSECGRGLSAECLSLDANFLCQRSGEHGETRENAGVSPPSSLLLLTLSSALPSRPLLFFFSPLFLFSSFIYFPDFGLQKNMDRSRLISSVLSLSLGPSSPDGSQSRFHPDARRGRHTSSARTSRRSVLPRTVGQLHRWWRRYCFLPSAACTRSALGALRTRSVRQAPTALSVCPRGPYAPALLGISSVVGRCRYDNACFRAARPLRCSC